MKRGLLLLLLLISCVGRASELPSWASSPRNVVVPSTAQLYDELEVSVDWDFVWGKIYVLNDERKWVEFRSKNPVVDGWVRDKARFELDLDSGFSVGKSYYVITYGCDRKGSSWDCNGFKWSLSSFSVVGEVSKQEVNEEVKEVIEGEVKSESKGEFVVYYGSGRGDVLDDYDFAIVQADSYSSDELKKFNAICYLSVAELEPDSCPGLPVCSDDSVFVMESGVKKRNLVWNSYFVDVSSPVWQGFVVERAKSLVAKGCKGVFFDTVDSVESSISDPVKRFEVVSLIKKVRYALPSSFLVLNRGTIWVGQGVNSMPVARHLSGFVDVVLIESFGTSFEFVSSSVVYKKQSVDGLKWLDDVASYLKEMKQKGDIKEVWVLDYRGRSDEELKSFGKSRADLWGFAWSSSNVYLDDIY